MLRRRLWIPLGIVGFILFAFGSYALAGPRDGPGNIPNEKHFKARLNGFQETPTVSSTGFGNFEAELVNDTTLHYVLTYDGLEGGTTIQAHVHFGARAITGGVSFFLCGPPASAPVTCPDVRGTVEGDITAANVIGPNGQGIEPGSFVEIIRAMQAGQAYANIHTTRWQAGEIRGQINNESQRQFDE
jgi:hypothetical protein